MRRRGRYREELETGDRVFHDSTEAIRSKYQVKLSKSPNLTKCPYCNDNFPHANIEEHKHQCRPDLYPAPTLTTAILPASKRTPASPKREKHKWGVRVNARTLICVHCENLVLNKTDVIARHLSECRSIKNCTDVASHFRRPS